MKISSNVAGIIGSKEIQTIVKLPCDKFWLLCYCYQIQVKPNEGTFVEALIALSISLGANRIRFSFRPCCKTVVKSSVMDKHLLDPRSVN